MAYIRVAFFVALIAYIHVLSVKAQYYETTIKALTTESPSSDRSFSIESSNAPDPQYEWDAVQCLSEAYMLHPDNLDTIIDTFGQLYKLKHTGNWRVNAGCSSIYIPNTNVVIVVKVTEGSDETAITLYN